MRRRIPTNRNTSVAVKFIFAAAGIVVGLTTVVSAVTIDLDEYVLDQTYSNIGSDQSPDPVADNLSGVTYNSTTNTLFTVLNGPELLVEINPLTGEIMREVELENFEDTEGIVHLGENRFGIVEEREHNFVVVTLDSGATSIDRLVSTNIPLGNPGANNRDDNSGIEGVAYDPITGTVYVVWEKEDPTIRSFDLSAAENPQPGSTFTLSEPFPASAVISPTTMMPFTDLAGLHFHTPTNTLLILSEENKEVIEMDLTTGTANSGSILLTNASGNFMDQPEGVAVGPDGTLYVVGEKDDLFVFVGPEPAVPEPSSVAMVILSAVCLLKRRRA